jgi:hypothetical protein
MNAVKLHKKVPFAFASCNCESHSFTSAGENFPAT